MITLEIAIQVLIDAGYCVVQGIATRKFYVSTVDGRPTALVGQSELALVAFAKSLT